MTQAEAAPPEAAPQEPGQRPAKAAAREQLAAQPEKAEARGREPVARAKVVVQAPRAQVEASLVREARRAPVVLARVEAAPMPGVTSMLEGVTRAMHRLTAAVTPTARRLPM